MKDKNFFIHESAYVDKNVKIGTNVNIWHFSHILSNVIIGDNTNIGQNVMIGPNVTIGKNCKIQNNVSIYDGVHIKDNVFLGPSCVFTNVKNPRSEINKKNEFAKTYLEEGVTIGANSTIVCGVSLEAYSFIGAGAVVTKNVKNNEIVVGNPARVIGYVCFCGEKLDRLNYCKICKKKIIF